MAIWQWKICIFDAGLWEHSFGGASTLMMWSWCWINKINNIIFFYCVITKTPFLLTWPCLSVIWINPAYFICIFPEEESYRCYYLIDGKILMNFGPVNQSSVVRVIYIDSIDRCIYEEDGWSLSERLLWYCVEMDSEMVYWVGQIEKAKELSKGVFLTKW